jgi:hypothetical protein
MKASAYGKPLAAFPLDFFGVPRCRLAAVETVAYILPQLFELDRACGLVLP